MPDVELKSIHQNEERDLKRQLIITVPANFEQMAKQPQIRKIVSVVAFYIVSSITMIMVNKVVLNVAALPMTFLWGQLITAVIVLYTASLFGALTLPPVNRKVLESLRFLIAMNVIGLTLNTLCLQHIDAALYQVARSLILPITVALSRFLSPGTTVPSKRTILACGIIFVGFTVGVVMEKRVKVNGIGVMFGVASSLATAIHSYAIKNSFSAVPNNGAFDMVFYNNLFSSVAILPLVFLESRTMIQWMSEHGSKGATMFVWGTAIAGASGLLINLAGFLQIKFTSPITHTVSSAARGVLQTIACRLILGEMITVYRCLGIAITLFGSALYSVFKAHEQQIMKN